jgi:hypothetical protein
MFLDNSSLAKIIRVHQRLSSLARADLYRSIELNLDRSRFNSCMEALSNDCTAPLVHCLTVNWDNKSTNGPDPILFSDDEGGKLIHCLKHLPNLQSLALNLTLFDDAKYLDDTFPFRLIQFSTNLRCDSHLLAFVERQSTLQDLRIDSSIDSSDPELSKSLGTTLPQTIRVLRWGQESSSNPAAFEFMRRISTIEEIHVVFPELGVMEDTMTTLKAQEFITQPTRAFFTILFNSFAFSTVSNGIGSLKYLSLCESASDPGCFNNVGVSFLCSVFL